MTAPFVSVLAAARPNFMKVAPVIAALRDEVRIELVHSGQHYGSMSDSFFVDLDLPSPDINLGVGSGTHAEQTGRVLVAYERHLLESRPDAVVVVGDVNSTLAGALAAAKLAIPVAHIEAGLRSFDWSMPEEVNRVLTDRLSRWLFTPSADADANLANEGLPAKSIHLVGNVMIDTMLRLLPRATEMFPTLATNLGIRSREYAVMTMHRPANVDDPEKLAELARTVSGVSSHLPLVFPIHPRTRARLNDLGLVSIPGVLLIEPLGYIDFLGLVSESALVLTDSGGIQEETSVLGVPCLTLRPNTERPITCTLGTNQVVGTEPDTVLQAVQDTLSRIRRPATIPLWDGHAAERIAAVLIKDLG